MVLRFNFGCTLVSVVAGSTKSGVAGTQVKWPVLSLILRFPDDQHKIAEIFIFVLFYSFLGGR